MYSVCSSLLFSRLALFAQQQTLDSSCSPHLLELLLQRLALFLPGRV
jgi:hypothetical protein